MNIWEYIFSYDKRIKDIDYILSNFTINNREKFYLLSFYHYVFLFVIMFFNIGFSKNFYIFIVSYVCLLIQIWINFIDNGCYLMKLERKYIGKWWFGPYTIFNICKRDIITPYRCSILFKSLSFGALIYGVLRLLNYNNTSILMSGFD